jgi:hypothetical protein
MKDKVFKLILCRIQEICGWYSRNFKDRYGIEEWPFSQYFMIQSYLEEIGCSCVRCPQEVFLELKSGPGGRRTAELLNIPEGKFFTLAHQLLDDILNSTTIILIPQELGERAAVLGEFPIGPKTAKMLGQGLK